MAPGMGGMGMGGIGGRAGVRKTDSLAQVIATTIDPESWDSNGGNGSVVQYHELLVVKNSQAVHGKIKALLEMMRSSARENPADGVDSGQPDPPPAALDAPANGRPGAPPFGVAPADAVLPAGSAPRTPATPKKPPRRRGSSDALIS